MVAGKQKVAREAIRRHSIPHFRIVRQATAAMGCTRAVKATLFGFPGWGKYQLGSSQQDKLLVLGKILKRL